MEAPTFEGRINKYSAELEKFEKFFEQMLIVFDSFEGAKRLQIGLNHEINEKKLGIVLALLDQKNAPRDFDKARENFKQSVMQIRDDYLANFDALVGNRDSAVDNDRVIRLDGVSRAKLRKDFESNLDERLNHYRETYAISDQTDLEAEAQKLDDYVTGWMSEFNFVHDTHTTLQEQYYNKVEELEPIIKEIKAKIKDCRTQSAQNLFHACYLGDLDAVKQLVTKKTDINARDEASNGKFTALHYAAYNGNTNVIRYLLEKKANPELFSVIEIQVRDKKTTITRGYNALQWAAQKGNLAAVRVLLAHKADPNALGDNKRAALHLACYQGHIPVARRLLACDSIACNGLTTIDDGRTQATPLHNAVIRWLDAWQRPNNRMVLMLLNDNRIDPHATSEVMKSPFEEAAIRNFLGDLKVLNAFLAHPKFYQEDDQFVARLSEIVAKTEQESEIRLRLLAYIADLPAK